MQAFPYLVDTGKLASKQMVQCNHESSESIVKGMDRNTVDALIYNMPRDQVSGPAVKPIVFLFYSRGMSRHLHLFRIVTKLRAGKRKH